MKSHGVVPVLAPAHAHGEVERLAARPDARRRCLRPGSRHTGHGRSRCSIRFWRTIWYWAGLTVPLER